MATIDAQLVTLTSQVSELLAAIQVKRQALDGIFTLAESASIAADNANAYQLLALQYRNEAQTFANSVAGVGSVNGRSGAVVLNATDITSALTFTPMKTTGDTSSGPISFSRAGTVRSQIATVSGDIWVLSNAVWDEAQQNFYRIDATKYAYAQQLQGQTLKAGEPDIGSFTSAATTWIARPAAYQLIRVGGLSTGAIFGDNGGWELLDQSLSDKTKRIGGAALVLENSKLDAPYGRLVHNRSTVAMSRRNTGVSRNLRADFSAQDTNTLDGFFSGYTEQFDGTNATIAGSRQFAVAKVPAGTTTWTPLLTIGLGTTGITTLAQDVSISSKGYLKLPSGTSIERPATTSSGMIRFNTDLAQFEGFNGSAWAAIGSGGSSTYTLPVASATTLGGVKASDIVPIDVNGLPSVRVATNLLAGILMPGTGCEVVDGKLNVISTGGYTLPPATPTTLGGIIPKDGLTTLADGSTTANVLSVFGRDGAVTLAASDVTGALGYTPQDAANATFTSSITAPGLTFSGVGARIRGDFSNANLASRLNFQTNIVDSGTLVGVLPNRTPVLNAFMSSMTMFESSDPNNGALGQVLMVGLSDFRLNSTKLGTGTYVPITMYTGGARRVTVDTGGTFLLNATAKAGTEILHVNGGIYQTGGDVHFNSLGMDLILGQNGSGTSQFTDLKFRTSASATDYDAMIRASLGGTGVEGGVLYYGANAHKFSTGGSHPDTYKVYVGYSGASYGMSFRPNTDTTRAIGFYNAANSLVGSISQTATSTAYNTTSDYRAKDGIVPLVGALARLRKLQPKRFFFKGDTAKEMVDGFIAHEAELVVPNAVSGKKDAIAEDGISPAWQGMDHGKLVPLIVAALQELEDRLNAGGGPKPAV